MSRFPPHPARRPAVVTGASSGIGRATALAMAAAGHPVILGARRIEICERLADEINGAGGEALALPLDLSETSSVEEFARGAESFGPVEVLISNAGQVVPGEALITSPKDFEALLSVNLVGPHRLVSSFAPAMVQRQRGDLVFVTSDVVERPRPAMASYVASKWGLEGYVQTLQMELESTGVRASVVRPGPTVTGMGADWDPEIGARVLNEWARWGQARHHAFLRPESVAAAIVSVISTAPGTHLTVVEVQPEGPLPKGTP